jgi:hypothetical protein
MKSFIPWICAALLCSCTTLRKSTGHDLNDGYYRVLEKNKPPRKVYLQVTDDSLFLYPSPLQPGRPSTQSFSLNRYPADSLLKPVVLLRTSMDLDLTTILLKYRFSTPALPNQLNSNLNAALYVGYRRDYFRFRESKDPLGKRHREINHFELDIGPFAGIGATAINPSTTEGQVAEEYDGVVLQKGVAVFFGGSRFSIGIGLGFDGLLDHKKNVWIYQNKPYLGLMIGLNLTN